MTALLVAVGLLLAGGLSALVAHRRPRIGSALAVGAVVGACAMGLPAAARALAGAPLPELRWSWAVPGGAIVLGLDPLASFFLLPLLVLAAVTAVYGRGYLLGRGDDSRLAVPFALFNLTVASMILVLLARQALVLLVAWELMSLSSYLLVVFDHREPEVRRAGWVYLIAAHVGVAALIGLYLLLGQRAGDLDFGSFERNRLAVGAGGGLAFFLATVGFGTKAGFVPLHVWLPEAHAAAPSHVSALMSGILIKLGLYGFLRTLTFLQPAGFWGPTLISLGIAGALLGISLAVYQRDLKRVLAYSSIENVGLVLLGLGIGYLGAQRGNLAVAALGTLGGLLHLWNHVLLKGLLFLAAGSVLHGSGTRDLEQLGGLHKRMPWTGTLMLLGAVGLSALPPLNGFISEWLIALGLVRGALALEGVGGMSLLFALGGLAIVGGLAALCYARLIGIALLGEPRTPAARNAHESPVSMLGPMVLLAAAGVLVAVAPGSVLGALRAVLAQILPAGADPDAALAPVGALVTASRLLWLALAVAGLLFALLLRGRPRASDETWGCGYAAPTPRMQYTAHSFSEIVSDLLPRRLGGRVRTQLPSGLVPSPGRVSSDYTDPLTRGLYEPLFDRLARRLAGLRWLQQGLLHLYLLYILLAVLAALAWSSLRHLFGSAP